MKITQQKHIVRLWLVVFLFISGYSYAQKKETEVHIDPSLETGKLDNGLTYYIRHNEVPEGRAEFYLFVKAGPVQEAADQNGVAHFCEHMAFNGTKHFPGKTMVDFIESAGIDFRESANAYTGQNKTVFCLNEIPTRKETIIDSSLLILLDWANYLSFENKEIDKERGVIHEEWRTTRTAGSRMAEKTNKVLYRGSKYAIHNGIGKVRVIDSCPYNRIKDFYRKWYRPSLQAVAVAGDIDVDKIEKKIKETFSVIPAKKNPEPRVVQELPDNEKPLIAIASDKESRRAYVRIYYKNEPVKPSEGDYFRRNFRRELYSIMFNARLKDLTEQEDPPFLFGAGHYGSLHPSKDAYITFASGENSQAIPMFQTLLRENERVKRHGFTSTELMRAKKELISEIESEYKSRGSMTSEEYIDKFLAHFMSNKPITEPEYKFERAKEVIPRITLKEMNRLPEKWIKDENTVIIIRGAESEENSLPSKADLLSVRENVKQQEIKPYKDQKINRPLMTEKIVAGKIAEESEIKDAGILKWTLSNGMQILIKQTSFNDNEILMRGYSPGGFSLVNPEKYPSARFVTPVIKKSGVGNFNRSQLKKKLVGKQMQVNPYFNLYSEGFTGKCEPDDTETLLKLINLYFNKPRKEKKALQGYLSKMKAQVKSKKLVPDHAFNDSVDFLLAGHHPAKAPITREYLKHVNLNEIMSIYKSRFHDASDFTFIFSGNIDPEKTKGMIEKYLGSIEDIEREENWKNLGIKPPEGRYKRVIRRKMKDPKSTVFLNYSGEYNYTPATNLQMELIESILDFRLTKTIREEQGGTYGVYVNEKHTRIPESLFNLEIQFTCDPEKAAQLKEILYKEIKRIYQQGPDSEILENIKRRMLNKRKQAVKTNTFWINSIHLDKIYEQEFIELDAFKRIIMDITVQDIKKTAKHYLEDTNSLEVLLEPAP